jgi:hypothetical protein
MPSGVSDTRIASSGQKSLSEEASNQPFRRGPGSWIVGFTAYIRGLVQAPMTPINKKHTGSEAYGSNRRHSAMRFGLVNPGLQ